MAFCLLLAFSRTPVPAAQDKPKNGGGEEKALYLIARPDLVDPLFKESVVVMFPPAVVAAHGLVVGLIINRPARVELSKIFPDDDALKDRSATAYFGGPVDPLSPGVIFRSREAVKQAALLFGDMYASFDPDLIRERLQKPEETPDLRLFVGRSQWSVPQLEEEMAAKSWYSLRAETSLIFSPSPQSLWRDMRARAEPPNVAALPGAPFALPAKFQAGVLPAGVRP